MPYSCGMSQAHTMKAWRTHRWGAPDEVLVLETVEVPEPGPGELLVRNQAIPLNLNDLERVTGGNMMVTPELPDARALDIRESDVFVRQAAHLRSLLESESESESSPS